MKTRICAAVTGKSLKEVKQMVKLAETQKADLIEVRIDFLNDGFKFPVIRRLTDKPLIATNKPTSEGGLSRLSDGERIRILLQAVNAGFEYVDIELSNAHAAETARAVRAEGAYPIISAHNFNSTPSIKQMMILMDQELKVGAEICKIIPTAQNFEDNLTCLTFLSRASENRKIVSFCMGDYGAPSRILSPLFGGLFTFASVQRGKESASGQLSVQDMRHIYRLIGLENQLED